MQKISLGRTVHYVLTADQAEQVNRRRTSGQAILERLQTEPPTWPAGAQAHIGNKAHEGDVVPFLVVGKWSDTCVNGQAFLDGNDVLRVTSAVEGTEPGTWHWPERTDGAVAQLAGAHGVVTTETSRSRRE